VSDAPIASWLNGSLLAAMASKALYVAVVRYVVIAVPGFVLAYGVFARTLWQRRIQQLPVSSRQAAREFLCSLSSCVVFAAIDIGVIVASVAGVMRVRVLDPSPGVLELAGSVVGLLMLHDAYFYWSHRFMHWEPVYRVVHEMHHRSLNPTPLAAFAFHPLEAVIQYGFVPLVALAVPIHVLSLFVFGIVMTALNAYGHSGIELMPAGFVRNRLGRVLLTACHHDLHHSAVRYNYGFYSSLWDRLMGTNHPHYEEIFARVAARAAAVRAQPAA
jgi:sterol desaturase/sphingolipid hydroxylase (fatty acid hydroxylase superfamily)